MQTWVKPQDFDGAKFAARYGLSGIDGDFGVTFVDGVEVVYVKDAFIHLITDDPPIFEPPDPPQIQGRIFWEDSGVSGALRLMVEYNNQKAVVVGAVGADTTKAAMYQSPGPIGQSPAGPRREFHLANNATLADLPVGVVDGDTLYKETNGEYRFSGGVWRRILTGPVLGSVGDTEPLYAGLNAALDAAINPPQGPNIDPRVKAVLIELRKLI